MKEHDWEEPRAALFGGTVAKCRRLGCDAWRLNDRRCGSTFFEDTTNYGAKEPGPCKGAS